MRIEWSDAGKASARRFMRDDQDVITIERVDRLPDTPGPYAPGNR